MNYVFGMNYLNRYLLPKIVCSCLALEASVNDLDYHKYILIIFFRFKATLVVVPDSLSVQVFQYGSMFFFSLSISLSRYISLHLTLIEMLIAKTYI